MNTPTANPAPTIAGLTALADAKEANLDTLRAAVAGAGQRPKAAIFREDKAIGDRAAHMSDSREHARGATASLLLKLRLDRTINEARLEAHDKMIAALSEEIEIERAARADVADAIKSASVHIEALEAREAGGV